MIATRARFDGHQIHLPDELRGARPGEVIVIYEEPSPTTPAPGSIWDAFGQSPRARTAEAIEAQVRGEREAWDEP